MDAEPNLLGKLTHLQKIAVGIFLCKKISPLFLLIDTFKEKLNKLFSVALKL